LHHFKPTFLRNPARETATTCLNIKASLSRRVGYGTCPRAVRSTPSHTAYTDNRYIRATTVALMSPRVNAVRKYARRTWCGVELSERERERERERVDYQPKIERCQIAATDQCSLNGTSESRKTAQDYKAELHHRTVQNDRRTPQQYSENSRQYRTRHRSSTSMYSLTFRVRVKLP